MNELQPLKPVDLVVALRLLDAPEEKYAHLGDDLGISPSTVHGSVRRLQAAGLLRPRSREVNRLALGEFLEHGIRYAFPARPGAEMRGIPTAHAAPPLADRIVGEDVIVWPSAAGPVRGQSLAPLYPQAAELPTRCPSLYHSLTLVDALRIGRVRERALALEAIRAKLAARAP